MIQFKDLVILSRKAPKNGLNLSFNNDLNFIEYSKQYLFKFLNLKNQSSDSGEFIVNNVSFFPNENKEHSLLYLAINSQVFVLSLTLVVTNEDKKTSIEALQNELATLRNMPLTNDEEKTKKINSILDIILKYPLGYVLINQNNEVNTNNKELISSALENYRDKATFVIYERMPEVDSAVSKKNELSNSLDNQLENNTFKGMFSKESFKYYGHILKTDILLFCLIGLEVAFSVFLANLAPYYFAINSTVWGVLLTVVLVLMFVIDILYIATSASFLDKPNPLNKKRYFINITYMILFTIIGIAIAYAVFFAFAANDIIVKKEKYTYDLVIASIVISALTLILPFFAKYLHKLTNKISSKFKK